MSTPIKVLFSIILFQGFLVKFNLLKINKNFRRKKSFGLACLPGDLDVLGNILTDETCKIENVCLPLPSFENKLPENEGF